MLAQSPTEFVQQIRELLATLGIRDRSPPKGGLLFLELCDAQTYALLHLLLVLFYLKKNTLLFFIIFNITLEMDFYI